MSGTRRASLAMYDLPALRSATDAWWAGLARAFCAAGVEGVPDALTRGLDLEALWLSPDLLFAQTCGYPLTHALAGKVTLVATPVYAAEGCEGPNYRSALILRRDDEARSLAELRGRRAAVNYRGSHSGWNILRREVAPLAGDGAFFSEVVESGSHGGSMAAVAEGRADLAAVDCVTYALTLRHDPDLREALRVLQWSAPAPGLPYITAGGADAERVARLRTGLAAACADPDLAEARETLSLTGVEVLPLQAYDRILELEDEALAGGYPEVA